MPINIQGIMERAFEQALFKALERTFQMKAEQMFKHALENGSPLSKKLEQKIDDGYQRFIEDGIRREKRKP